MKQFVLGVLLCAACSGAFAIDICLFRIGDWRKADDPRALALMQENMARLPGNRRNFVPMVCTGSDRNKLPVPGRVSAFPFGETTYLVLYLDSQFRSRVDDVLPAFLGHELGHWSRADPFDCHKLFQNGQRSSYITCEHEVDEIAARWSSREMVREWLQVLIGAAKDYPAESIHEDDRRDILDQLSTRLQLFDRVR